MALPVNLPYHVFSALHEPKHNIPHNYLYWVPIIYYIIFKNGNPQTTEYWFSLAPGAYDLPMVEGSSRSQQWMNKMDPECRARKMNNINSCCSIHEPPLHAGYQPSTSHVFSHSSSTPLTWVSSSVLEMSRRVRYPAQSPTAHLLIMHHSIISLLGISNWENRRGHFRS